MRTLLMSFALAAFAFVLITGTSRTTAAPPEGEQASAEPVLVELFTSQGCSSCPPADRLAERLAREEDFVIISRPVDYWDRLGWRDTLASPENTALQRAYAERRLGGYNGVYTPQSVIAGQYGEVGSDEGALRRFARDAQRDAVAALRINLLANGDYAIGLGGETGERAELVLIGVSRRESIAIGRGENGGRTVSYTNVLRGERRINEWDGGKAAHRLAGSQLNMPGADRYALVLREPNAGRVLAARWLPSADR